MTRPSVGKAGTHGCFLVEVLRSGTRSLARRFVTEAEGKDFYTRTVSAHQQKANRERHAYVIEFHETTGPRSTDVVREIDSAHVQPN